MEKKILMVSPPPVFPVVPEAGGPYIASYLKNQGIPIEYLDLGILCFHKLLDASNQTHKKNGMDLKKTYQDLQKFQNRYYRYKKTVNEFEKSCIYHSRQYPPYGMGFYFIPPEYLDESDKMRKHHPFLDYGQEILDESGIENYDFVLFSVSQPKQFPITMELSKYIKSRNKNAVVIIGGAYVSVILDSIARKLFLNYFTSAFDFIDYMAPKMGELTIVRLLHSLVKEGRPDGYVLFRDEGKIRIINNYQEPKLDDLPSPDFDGIDFSLYLTPKPIFPLRTTTRCYWGKCSFCRGNGNTFAEHLTFRQAQKVYEDMVYLNRKYDSPYFCFCEDSTPPAMMTKLSKILIEKGENFCWGTQGIRLENCITEEDVRLWAKAGCKHLSFGLETGSQSLIRKVNKGIELSKTADILKWCTDNGIFTLCYALFGHPDETDEEWFESIDFLDKNSKNIFTYSFSKYFLTPYQADYVHYSADEEIKAFFDNMINYSNEIRYFGATRDYDMENWSKSYQTKMYKIYEKNDRRTKFLSYCGYNLTLPSAFIKKELRNDNEFEENKLDKQKLLLVDLTIMEELCNLRCAYCGHEKLNFDKLDDLVYQPNSLLYRNLNSLMEVLHDKIDAPVLKISGGEIFMIPGIMDFIKEQCRHFPLVQILTNGTLLPEKELDQLDPDGNIIFQISLDGHTFGMNQNRFKTESQFHHVLENVKTLAREGFNVEINTVLTSANVKYLGDFMDFLTALDGMVRFFPFPARWVENFNLNDSEIEVLHSLFSNDKYQKLLPLKLYREKLINFLESSRDFPCFIPKRVLGITESGMVRACACGLCSPKILTIHDNFDEIFQQTASETKEAFISELCSSCFTNYEFYNLILNSDLSVTEMEALFFDRERPVLNRLLELREASAG